MRVHGNKMVRRRPNVGELNRYQEAREYLLEDFYWMCGYCGKSGEIMHQRFHIDHFVPQSLAPELTNNYNNLVLACPKCNRTKSKKWPTKDKNVHNDGYIGFVDPATKEFDQHLERNDHGFIQGKTKLGKYMCQSLHFDIRRTDLYWKIQHLYETQSRLEELFLEHRLNGDEKDFYISSNIMLKKYIQDAFEKGE